MFWGFLCLGRLQFIEFSIVCVCFCDSECVCVSLQGRLIVFEALEAGEILMICALLN